MSKFIPVYAYASKNKVSEQSVYRYVRENKFLPEEVKVEEVVVTRIKIKEDAKPKFLKKTKNQESVETQV
jgi:hypothetical protein